MKKSRVSEVHIIKLLKRCEAGEQAKKIAVRDGPSPSEHFQKVGGATPLLSEGPSPAYRPLRTYQLLILTFAE